MKFDVVAKYDVVIIGSGISGLLSALELASNKKTVCILTKEAVTESSSLYAQGGIAVPIGKSDTVEKHLADTLNAGTLLCNITVAKEIISHSSSALEKLISYGVKFDLSSENLIHQTKEGAHSVSRVCHVGGDASGRYITKTLIDRACREKNISISQGSIVLNILKNEQGRAYGVLVEDVTHSKYVLFARDIIVATGGIGQLYKNTTNPLVCTGDGIVMAYQIGAEVQDVEMVQFHPTVLLEYGDPFLITEAIRGEGATLKNVGGELFAFKYHELGELAPRDILARAILSEIKKSEIKKNEMLNHVYLDLSNFNVEYFKTRFPTIYQTCLERKVDLFNSGIPVSPAAHYFIGGIRTNISGKTTIPGLWALGEVASNGFHGANRLASNSLLECIVVPNFLTKNLLSEKAANLSNIDFVDLQLDEKSYDENELRNIKEDLQARNLLNLGLLRNKETLKGHLNWLNDLKSVFNIDMLSSNCQAQELKNMLLLSGLICQAAQSRTHSLGAHYREDFPDVPLEFKHSIFKQKGQFSWEIEKSQKNLIPILK